MPATPSAHPHVPTGANPSAAWRRICDYAVQRLRKAGEHSRSLEYRSHPSSDVPLQTKLIV